MRELPSGTLDVAERLPAPGNRATHAPPIAHNDLAMFGENTHRLPCDKRSMPCSTPNKSFGVCAGKSAERTPADRVLSATGPRKLARNMQGRDYPRPSQ